MNNRGSNKPVVGIFAKHNPFTDQNEWSGTVYHTRQAIENAGYEVRWIRYKPNALRWLVYNPGIRLLHGRHSKVRQLPAYARMCAKSVDVEAIKGCDYLFFPGGAEMLPYLHIKRPSIYLVDATFRLMSGYYHTRNSEWCRVRGESNAKLTYRACDRIIAASTWAAESLVNDYGIDKDKVTVMPFGANVSDADIIYRNRKWRSGETLRLLFSGVEWDRKGGAVAVEATGILRDRGYDARITIMGIKELPEQYRSLDYIVCLGFLNKNDRMQYTSYIEAYGEAHVFILPTHAECAGVVFCEASGAGVPIVTYDTGGIPDYVVDGVNGFRLDTGAAAEDFADAVEAMLPKLSEMSANARGLYEQRLNWDRWGEGFRQILQTL